jgi:hypothetical protein
MGTPIYRFGCLRIASDFPLFGLELSQTEAEEPCDVTIRRAPMPEEAVSTTAKFLEGQYTGTYNGNEVFFSRGSIGRFLLRAGKEILMELAPSPNDDEVRGYLLGAVLGTLCHQRGITPVHASLVDVADGCAAFIGASGAGKSTLVAALGQRGRDVISDDECFLQLDSTGNVQAWPGINQIRLWEDARAALGFDGPGIERMTRGKYKSLISIRPARDPMQSRPLRGVYQLHRVPNGALEISRLRGAEAVEVLMQNVYPPGLADCLGLQSHVFQVCTAVAQNVPVFRFSRPWDFAVLDQSIDLLESHLPDRLA